ncbi:hypothetical protein ABET51_15715 [Metabacillus fastidiosus]|uniref:hypothetical protein n=1 Tax=Metabacillus fastidiosus TaxID=1458 RepID=UPI002E1F52C9|nr:hypothetical protein [Metabacillus fastidiosus]
MKKLLSVLIIMIFSLAACNSELNIVELEFTPDDLNEVLEVLDSKDYIQLVNDGNSILYLVIDTKETITVSVKAHNDQLLINIKEVESENKEVKQHIFRVMKDKDYEEIGLYKNGKQISIDTVTSI